MMPRSADYEVKLTADHESLRHTIRDFAEKEIRPVAFEIDRNNKIPRDLLRRIAGVGLTAITYKEEYGGLGGDLLSMVIAIEEIADLYLVFARTSPPPSSKERHKGLSAFIVERGTEGFQIGSHIETTGLRGSQPSELILDHVKVPTDNLVGKEGDGFYIGVKTYDRGRVDVSAQGVGIAQAAYEAAISYAQTRTSFEKPLIDFQQVQYKLAEMAMGLHTARLLTYWAASLKDQGKEFVKAASIAKVTSTETAERLALLAMMIHGGYGVATEYPVERFLRDSQIIKTYEGTNDIQRLTIAKQLIRELKE